MLRPFELLGYANLGLGESVRYPLAKARGLCLAAAATRHPEAVLWLHRPTRLGTKRGHQAIRHLARPGPPRQTRWLRARRVVRPRTVRSAGARWAHGLSSASRRASAYKQRLPQEGGRRFPPP